MRVKSIVGKSLRRLGLYYVVLTTYDLISFFSGMVFYLFKKTTPEWAYQSFVRLFCVTRGYSNDVLSFVISMLHPPKPIKQSKGILPLTTKEDFAKAADKIHQEGYLQYSSLVSKEVCDALTEIALSEPSLVRPMDVGLMTFDKPIHVVYDPKHPVGIRYDMFIEQLIKYPLIQKIVTDPTLLNLAQSYLGASPVLDGVNMWWCTAIAKEASGESAQKYHFDLERPKWIKFFVYLTDIDEETGPHCFVAKSHKSNRIPWSLLKRGYARIEDDEVSAVYDQQDILVMTGAKGTLLAEDTRGLHKGQHLKRGERLIFQIQYSNSLFATETSKIQMSNQQVTSELATAIEMYPRIFQRLVVNQ